MKKLLLVLILFPTSSFAISGDCHRQSNPIGYTNYDVCEVTGTGYSCVSLEGNSGGIACFPTPVLQEDEEYEERNSAKHKDRFNKGGIGDGWSN